MKTICVLQSNMVSNSDLRDMISETRRRVRLAMILVSYLELKQHLCDLSTHMPLSLRLFCVMSSSVMLAVIPICHECWVHVF
jgi:hypothetical protein